MLNISNKYHLERFITFHLIHFEKEIRKIIVKNVKERGREVKYQNVIKNQVTTFQRKQGRIYIGE